MFKQIGISKKIVAGIVAGLMLSSFFPVQTYSTKDAKCHIKKTFEVCKPSAEIVGGMIACLMSFEALIEKLSYNYGENRKYKWRSFSPRLMVNISYELRHDYRTYLFPIGIVFFIFGVKGLTNQLYNKKQNSKTVKTTSNGV
ncbi:MAG TPA: hypothetical protein ENI08_01570 [Candidatus Dependentiae bacterium]|nr:hypothetical protein [Candidatus Dependentiae bacterium]